MQNLFANDAKGSLSGGFRARRFEFFKDVSELAPGMTVLDCGGTPWSSFFKSRDDLEVTYLNTMAKDEEIDRCLLPNHRYGEADARDIPFEDGAFDIVFANSLLEHIPLADRLKVATEMMRVGKFLFVEVPYRYFPWEPHYNFPLAQFLPLPIKGQLGRRWPLSHRHGDPTPPDENLPSRREMSHLFPELTLTAKRVGPLTKALYAWGRTS